MGIIVAIILILIVCFIFFSKKNKGKQVVSKEEKPVDESPQSIKLGIIPLMTPMNCPDAELVLNLWKKRAWDNLCDYCMAKAIEEDNKLDLENFSKETKEVILHNIWVWKRNCIAAKLMRDAATFSELLPETEIEIMAPRVGLCEKDAKRYDFLEYYEHLRSNRKDTECWYPCVGCKDCSSCGISIVPKERNI